MNKREYLKRKKILNMIKNQKRREFVSDTRADKKLSKNEIMRVKEDIKKLNNRYEIQKRLFDIFLGE